VPGRVVIFGATGYTGRLVAGALVRGGQGPVLAGRSPDRLRALVEELGGGLEVAQADVRRQDSVRELVGERDVLVSTVGPFARLGDAAAGAALRKGAHYLDSNGEPAFTRRVFEGYGPRAAATGIVMLTAFGWECVLGNLAGALALREGGEAATRVDTGYFYTGRVAFSGGTRASWASAIAEPGFAYRAGAIRTVRGAERHRAFRLEGAERDGVSFGASEHFALPRTFPHLREVNAYQGWFGRRSPRVARVLHRSSRAGSGVFATPGVRPLYEATTRRLMRGSTGGPTPEERTHGGVHVVGIAYDGEAAPLAEAHVEGPEGYELTAALLAWGAGRLGVGNVDAAGALGPVEAFGLDDLLAGLARAGIVAEIA
jgi:short subunit dehydrogenase-like uncharacterized protein